MINPLTSLFEQLARDMVDVFERTLVQGRRTEAQMKEFRWFVAMKCR